MKKWKSWLPLLLMLALAVTLGLALLTGRVSLGGLLDLARENQPLLAGLLLLLYVVKGCSGVLLHNALVLAAALAFPLWISIPLNLLGTALCLSASFLIGRHSHKDLEQELEKYPKVARAFRSCKRHGFLLCFTVHTLGLSLEVQGVLFGLTPISFGSYLLSSLLAVCPGMLCVNIAGGELGFSSPAFWGLLLLDLLIIGGSLWYSKKQWKEEEQSSSETGGSK